MENERYPKLGTTNRMYPRNQFGRYGRHGHVQCDACEREATTRAHVQTSWFRGEDEVLNLCSVHTAMARAGEWTALYRDIKEREQ
jgi:hypothetical protein